MYPASAPSPAGTTWSFTRPSSASAASLLVSSVNLISCRDDLYQREFERGDKEAESTSSGAELVVETVPVAMTVQHPEILWRYHDEKAEARRRQELGEKKRQTHMQVGGNNKVDFDLALCIRNCVNFD
jgi:hypothetical protein